MTDTNTNGVSVKGKRTKSRGPWSFCYGIKIFFREFIERPDMRANSASVIFVLSNVSIISWFVISMLHDCD